LLNDPQKCPPNLKTSDTIKELAKYAIWPIAGMLFHPIYTVVNAAVVGRFEDSLYLSALGLGSLTVGIMLISICACFCLVIGSFVAPAYGDDRLDLAKIYLYRQFILNACIFLIALIPTLWIYDFYIAIGQTEERAVLAAQYVHYVSPGVLFHV